MLVVNYFGMGIDNTHHYNRANNFFKMGPGRMVKGGQIAGCVSFFSEEAGII